MVDLTSTRRVRWSSSGEVCSLRNGLSGKMRLRNRGMGAGTVLRSQKGEAISIYYKRDEAVLRCGPLFWWQCMRGSSGARSAN